MATDNKELARVLDSLGKAGVTLENIADLVQTLSSRGLLPKVGDPLRNKIRDWALAPGKDGKSVMDEIQEQYSDSWSFSVTVRDGWSIQFVNRRKMNEKNRDGDGDDSNASQ